MKKFDIFNAPIPCPADGPSGSNGTDSSFDKRIGLVAYWKDGGNGYWSNSSCKWKDTGGWTNSSTNWKDGGYGRWSNSSCKWKDGGGWSNSTSNWKDTGGWSNSSDSGK